MWMTAAPGTKTRLTTVFQSPLLRIAIGTWIIVAGYAVLHDQGIVRVAPEHFTVWHPAIPGVQSPALQAAILAFLASLAPGLAFGIGLAFASQEGPAPVEPVSAALRRAGFAVLATELVAVGVGVLDYATQWRIYGPDWYPPHAAPELIATQSTQLTAYLAGSGTAALALGWTVFVRWRRMRSEQAVERPAGGR